MRFSLALLFLCALWPCYVAVCAEPSHEPGDRFYEAYQLWNSAEKLEQASEKEAALKKYLAARDRLTALSTTFPTWSPEIVAYRKERVDLALTRLGHPEGSASNATDPASPKPAPGKGDELNALQLDNATKDQIIASLTAKVETPSAGQPQPLSGEEILAALKTRSDELARHIAGLSGQPNALDPATQDALKQAGAELDTLSSAKAMAAIVAENARLKKDLESTQHQVEALKQERNQSVAEASKLKSQVSELLEQIGTLRTQNNTYQSHVAELTMKLRQLDPTKTGELEDPKLVAENKALRAIIIRHLRQQERLRQSKEIVIAEMKRMQDVSQVLMENLEDMTSGKVWVTVDEESLFSEPELETILALGGASTGTLVASSPSTGKSPQKTDLPTAKGKSASPVKSAGQVTTNASKQAKMEQRLLTQSTIAMEGGDFETAEEKLQDLLRANPKSSTALTTLARIKLSTKQHDEADVLLQKCLVYEPENSAAHFLLGLSNYGQNKFADAITHFEKAATQPAESAKSHHYLGIIASQMQNRARAETEFKSAIASDPNYADAHFNLAVVYATNTP
ncbi:MAG: tetratricopeptide repeat protein, partial [Roseimicrobium sp.]